MKWSVRRILAMLLLLSLPCAALAEAQLGDYIYGAWSEWGTGWAPKSETLDVESRRANEVSLKDTWTYKRYVYFNTGQNAWYATSNDRPGAMERPGSGRWEQQTFDAPREQIGVVDGEIEYKGHWFFEEKGQAIAEVRPITQYRTRPKTRVLAKLGVRDIAIANGETYQIQLELAAGIAGVKFKSSNEKIVTVSEDGTIKAQGIGSAHVDVLVGDRRVERMRVSVGERIRGISSELHSIRLYGTDLYLSPVKGGRKSGTALVATDGVKPQRRYFKVIGQADSAFRIRLAAQQVLFVSLKEKDKLLRLAPRGSNKIEQLFGILRLKGGRDLLYLVDEPDRFLTASPNGVLAFKPYEADNAMMRWELVPAGQDAEHDGLWTLPYQRDGRCYISGNFEAGEHNGLDVGSNGARVNALSVAPGKVVYTFSGCTHDYGKKPNKKGKLKDPCGDDRSYGNQVVIEHANGMRTAYAHLSQVLVKEGDRVRQGDVIGVTGSTGQSTAVHLHFEVRAGSEAVNPRKYIEFPKIKKD